MQVSRSRERSEKMDSDSPEPVRATESIGPSSVTGSDFDGMSDSTAATPFSSCGGSTGGDGPPSMLNDIKVEVEENEDDEIFSVQTDFQKSKLTISV